jgi:HlyD family secretion protein
MMGAGWKQPPGRSFSRRLRFWRRRYLPLVVWLAAIAAAGFLLERQAYRVDAVGVVELRQVAVAPLVNGALQSIGVDLLDPVKEGQLIGLMDDAEVAGELRIAESELSRLEASLAAENQRLVVEQSLAQAQNLNDFRQFVVNEEQARLDLLDRQVSQETDRVALQRLEILLNRQKQLLEEQLIDVAAYDEARLQYANLEKQILENEAAIAVARRSLDEAIQRRSEREKDAESTFPLDPFLQPFRAEIRVQEARIAQLKDQRLQLALKAPVSGHISAVLCRTGQTVLAGSPIVMIADDRSQRVVAYVDEKAGRSIEPGAPVDLRSRLEPHIEINTAVSRVSLHVEEMPARLWRTPLVPQWGMPVLISDVPSGLFIPGEVVQLRLTRRSPAP